MESIVIKNNEISLPLAAGIIFLPVIFAWVLLKKGYPGRARLLSFSWLVVTIWACALNHNDQPTNIAKTPQPDNSTAVSASITE